MAIPIVADDLAVKVCEALGLNADDIWRVIIDLKIGEAAIAYVEMLGTNRLFDVQWDSLNGAKIATEPETKGIESIKRLGLQTGETLVVNLDHHVSFRDQERIKEMLQTRFPDNQILICEKGVSLSVMGADE